jgi:hypothetical protein
VGGWLVTKALLQDRRVRLWGAQGHATRLHVPLQFGLLQNVRQLPADFCAGVAESQRIDR